MATQAVSMNDRWNKTAARAAFVLPALHLLLCIATRTGLLPSEGSWAWFLVFLVDFPFSILLLQLLNVVDPLLVFGILGTLWWYLVSRLLLYCVKRVRHYFLARRPPTSKVTA